MIAALLNLPHTLPSALGNRLSQAFAQHTQTTLSLDWAAENSATTEPTRGASQCPTNLISPLGLQALVIENR